MILWYKDIKGKYRVLDQTPTGYWVKGRLSVPCWDPEFTEYLRQTMLPLETFYRLFDLDPDYKVGLWVLKEDVL